MPAAIALSKMMIDAALAALNEMFTPPFRKVLYKTLALTLALLALVFAGLDKFILHFIALPYAWANTLLSILTIIGLIVALAFVVAPVSFVIAGLFFDDLAEVVEHKLLPPGPIGRAPPIMDTIWLAIKFALVAVCVNVIAVLLLLVPGLNAIAFFVANAYLFGRGYFELSAFRYLPLESVRRLRQRHAVKLFVAGLFISAFVLVPLLNLLTPLFATAFMVRVSKDILRPELKPAG
jgi:CysZ protein